MLLGIVISARSEDCIPPRISSSPPWKLFDFDNFSPIEDLPHLDLEFHGLARGYEALYRGALGTKIFDLDFAIVPSNLSESENRVSSLAARSLPEYRDNLRPIRKIIKKHPEITEISIGSGETEIRFPFRLVSVIRESPFGDKEQLVGSISVQEENADISLRFFSDTTDIKEFLAAIKEVLEKVNSVFIGSKGGS